VITSVAEKAWTWMERVRLGGELRTLNQNLERIIVERTRHLDAAVREREVLLREIHHRVKNNLQVISSLLGMQSHHVADPTVRAVLEESRTRVQAIALVHENLYQTHDLAEIGFAGYVRGLAAHLIATYGGAGRGITVQVDAADVRLSVTHAIPCGLIVSELVTNALKHAFPGERGGVITIALADEPEQQLRLQVGDDGVGLAADLDLRNLPSMGMDLVFAFAEQLQATVEVTGSPGTCFTIRFPR
jgi:two-component sensor histidine kinase